MAVTHNTLRATSWLSKPAWLLVAVLGCDTVGSGSLVGQAAVRWSDDGMIAELAETELTETEGAFEVEADHQPVETSTLPSVEAPSNEVDPDDCRGAVKVSTSPGGDMVVCDDVDDRTCEQDMEQLCPVGWGLCSHAQFVERNDGWTYPVNAESVVVGEIYDRAAGGFGHFTLGPFDDPGNLASDIAINCAFGSDRGQQGVTAVGCNERTVQALCCAPSALCGNGVVDSPEEQCDDGNLDDGDGCLSSCALSAPGAGLGC